MAQESRSDWPTSNNSLAHPIAWLCLLSIILALQHHLGDALMGRRRLAFNVTVVSCYAVWALLIGLRLRLDPSGQKHVVIRIDYTIFWFGSLCAVAIAALLIPIADPPTQIAIAMVQTGNSAVLIAANARFPMRHRVADLMPLVIPVGTILVLQNEGSDTARFAAAALGFYTLIFVLQRSFVRKQTDSLLAARQALEHEQATRLRFIASASHDLGQPLQSARMFLDSALRAPDAPAREAAGRKARWAFDSADTMLRALIDHLRLDSGTVTAHPVPQPAGPLLARVAALHEPAARLAAIDLRTLPTRLGLIADAGLAERALGNLVGNAIRHSKGRRLLVGARRHGNSVRLWVIDDGRGIAPADHACLFTEFAQGSDHGDEVRGGFGLGLASAQRMAALMDGRVGHDPRWDKGSAFFLELPAAAPQNP
jgi:signal transduction histidine kinase